MRIGGRGVGFGCLGFRGFEGLDRDAGLGSGLLCCYYGRVGFC